SQAVQRSGALGWGKLRYGQLVVTDARGKVIPATLTHKGDRILIAFNDTHAAYPLTVDPLVWLEQEVVASDGVASDQFGYTVALDGTTAFIGSLLAAVNGNSGAGAVYVFNESNGVWTQTQKLTASDAASTGFAEFGQAIALDGTTALIGADLATIKGNTWQGAAYFFTESNGTWTQTQEVTASDGAEWGTFGEGAALGDNVAFVSAGSASVNGVPVPSSVYVFEESNGAWTQTQEIPSPNQAGDEFGYGATIGISGTTAVVGAYAATVKENQYQGNATVYTESNGTWTQTQQLTGSDSTADNYFGTGVTIQGNTILIGAELAEGTGTAYVFTNSNGTWTQSQELTANDGVAGDAFGSFTALDGMTALIGATGYNAGVGKAYIFTNSNGTWTQTQELAPSDQPTEGFFGFSGALSMPTGLIGAHGVTVNGNAFQGAAYFEGQSDLGLNVSAPQTVGQGQTYVSQTIATNNASAASPAVSATVTVPAAASFVSASATQGSCSEASGLVTCDFGQINANAGTATANVTLKAIGGIGTVLENKAGVVLATPALTAGAATLIVGNCPDGYTRYDGNLLGGTRAIYAAYYAPAGEQNAILAGPAGFHMFALVKTATGLNTYRFSASEVHRRAPAGIFEWGVRAGSQGGYFTLCIQHP
ncbi:MAG: FG-GAP repeat protein, partial [Chloroflexota bacterium]